MCAMRKVLGALLVTAALSGCYVGATGRVHIHANPRFVTEWLE